MHDDLDDSSQTARPVDERMTPRLESWNSAQADWTRLARARNLLMEAGIQVPSVLWDSC